MSTLVTFKDTDTGCELGYIHTNNQTPTCVDIERAMNTDVETLSNMRIVGEAITEGNLTIALVRYDTNGWDTNPLPQVGTLTFFARHNRSETPGTIFMIG